MLSASARTSFLSMKHSWKKIPLSMFLIWLLLPCISSSKDGENCETMKSEGNRTYKDVTWCDHGCCQDDGRSEICCDASTITSGMVYGFVITGSLVMLIFCIYFRLRIAARSVKPQTTPAPPDDASPEVSPAQQEPPPPYWMCVSEHPPQDVTTTPFSPTLTSSEDPVPTQRHSACDAVPPEMNTVLAENGDGSLNLATSTSEYDQGETIQLTPNTSSAPPTELSKGVVLQPSTLGIPSFNASSLPAENVTHVGGEMPWARSQEGTVVMFVPGQMSADVCRSLLQSSGSGSQVISFHPGTAHAGSSLDHSGLSGCANPSYTSTEDLDTESSTTAPPSETRSEETLVRESSMSEILKQIPTGTVLCFDNRGGSVIVRN